MSSKTLVQRNWKIGVAITKRWCKFVGAVGGVDQGFRLDILTLPCQTSKWKVTYSNIYFITFLLILYIHSFFPLPSVNNQTKHKNGIVK